MSNLADKHIFKVKSMTYQMFMLDPLVAGNFVTKTYTQNWLKVNNIMNQNQKNSRINNSKATMMSMITVFLLMTLSMFSLLGSEKFSGTCPISLMELFAKIVNSFYLCKRFHHKSFMGS